MLLPLFIDSPVPLEPFEQGVVIAACSEALSPDRCTLATDRGHSVYGLIRLDAPEIQVATLMVFQGDASKTHQIEFRGEDLRQERLRALGLVVASLWVSSRVQPGALVEPTRPAEPQAPPAGPAEPKWRVHLGGLVSHLGEAAFGPVLNVSYALGPFGLGPQLSVGAQRFLNPAIDSLDLGTVGLGIAASPSLAERWTLPVAVRLQAEGFRARGVQGTETDRATATRLGGAVSAGARVEALPPLSIELGILGALFRNGPTVRVADEEVQQIAAYSLSAYVGIGWTH